MTYVKEECLIIPRGTKVQGGIFEYSSKGGGEREMSERVIRTNYWIDGDAIYGAEAEYYKGSFWRKSETTRLVKQYDSEEKALEGLKTLRKEAGYTKDLPFGKRHFSSMPE